jgi:hypothetical protein
MRSTSGDLGRDCALHLPSGADPAFTSRNDSAQQPIEFAPNDCVAFASGFLETFAIEDRDLPRR